MSTGWLRVTEWRREWPAEWQPPLAAYQLGEIQRLVFTAKKWPPRRLLN
jgi:hypothetical protein